MPAPVKSPRAFSQGFALSLGLHLGLTFLAAVMGIFTGRFRPPPQNVLTARLVRLGAPRAEALLPRKVSPAATPKAAAPSSTPVAQAATKAPPAAKAEMLASTPSPKVPAPSAPIQGAPVAQVTPADARARIQELGKVTQALDRLRRQTDGRADGSTMGEVDIAQEGDAFATAVKTCLERNYVIEGADPARVRGLTAQVVLRIQADGTIMGFHLARASGVKAFDDAVARAVKRCQKTVPPPPAWRRVVGQEGIEIEFHP